MEFNRLALSAVAVACVAPAGGGAFLATRQDVPPVAQSATPAISDDLQRPVQETEGVISPAQVVPPEAPTVTASRPDPAPRPVVREKSSPASTTASRRPDPSP